VSDQGLVVVDDAWLDVVARLFLAARGNDRFVKVRPIGRLLAAWRDARRASPESIPRPHVDAATGLVPWTTWSPVLAEAELGTQIAAPPSDEELVGDGPRARLKRRERAAHALANASVSRAQPLGLEDGRVDVRSIAKDSAALTLCVDRVTASGLIVRLSADVTLAVSAGAGIVVDDDRAKATAPVMERLGRSVQLPAPAVAVQLAALGGVRVTRVTRGVIGPCRAQNVGALLAPYATNATDACLVLSFEELALDVAAHNDNDAFATDDLSALMRALPGELSALRAFRDARVITTPAAAATVRSLAARRGTKTVITEVA